MNGDMDTIAKKTVAERYKALEVWSSGLASALEQKLRRETGIAAFQCFVHDQFEAAFPEDHMTRDQRLVFISLRLSLDLKTMAPAAVADLKMYLKPQIKTLSILRDNFEDSPIRLDFDWHLSEKERDTAGDEGQIFAQKVLDDCLFLSKTLRRFET